MKSNPVKKTTHKMAKAFHRDAVKEFGFYDGRFRERAVTPKIHKPIKHKGKKYEDD